MITQHRRHLSFALFRLPHALASVMLVILFCAIDASAQNAPDPRPSVGPDGFFRTTITSNTTPLLMPTIYHDTAGNLVVQGAPLVSVIATAWNLRTHQIVDGPAWIDTPCLYDIEAVPPPAFVESNEQQMLKRMLADRFSLAVRMGARDLKTLVLELSDTADPADFAAAPADATVGQRQHALTGPIKFKGSLTFGDLAQFLSMQLGEPVIDRTGLPGPYHIELGAYSRKDRGSIIATLETAGLTLRMGTTTTEVLVIDRISHPELDE